MLLELIPNKSLGKFKFGMRPKDIIDILGYPDKINIIEGEKKIDVKKYDVNWGDYESNMTFIDILLYNKTIMRMFNKFIVKDTYVSIFYNSIRFIFYLENECLLSNILVDNNFIYKIMYKNNDLFKLKKIELIEILNSEYEFEYYDVYNHEFISFNDFNDFKNNNDLVSAILDFENLNITFFYDKKFNVLESIALETDIF